MPNNKKQIKPEISTGDYITLSLILGIKKEAAAARFRRNNLQAIEVMKVIVKSREKVIKDFLKSKKKGS